MVTWICGAPGTPLVNWPLSLIGLVVGVLLGWGTAWGRPESRRS